MRSCTQASKKAEWGEAWAEHLWHHGGGRPVAERLLDHLPGVGLHEQKRRPVKLGATQPVSYLQAQAEGTPGGGCGERARKGGEASGKRGRGVQHGVVRTWRGWGTRGEKRGAHHLSQLLASGHGVDVRLHTQLLLAHLGYEKGAERAALHVSGPEL